MTSLPDTLQQLSQALTPPPGSTPDSTYLVALLPCEPAVGPVAVACWTDGDGGEDYQLVRLDDGQVLHDRAALREALTLLAMTETLEELASFDQLDEIGAALREWRAATPAGADLDEALQAALGQLDALAALAPTDDPRLARTQLLDELSAALRALDGAWNALEQSAEAWSDAYLDGAGSDPAAVELVQNLWRALAGARRGPLAQPVNVAIHGGREAGTAMASAIAEATRESQ